MNQFPDENVRNQFPAQKAQDQVLSRFAQQEYLLESKNQELLQANIVLKQELNRYKRSKQLLLATKARLKNLIASSPIVIYSRQPERHFGITFVSESICQFGYKPTDFLHNETLWQKYVHPHDLPEIRQQISSLTSSQEKIFEYRFLQKDGNYCWIQDQCRLVDDQFGNPLEIIGSWQNITVRKNMEEVIFQEKELAQITLESIGDAVITTNHQGYIEYLNPMAEKITAWSLEEAKGIHFQQVLNIYSEKQTHRSEFLFHKVLKEKATIKQECVLIARNNQQYPINKSVAPIKNKQNEIVGMVFVFRDITQNRKLSAQLFWQANHDSLTGLMNRSYFEEKIKEALLKARKKNNYYSLCYLDIDRFKIVNDTCGHQAGDELLRQLATLLKRLTRSTDLVARLGGDEFGILFQKCSLDAAQKIAEKIRAAVEEYIFLWENKSFHLGVSIGLVGIDSHTSSQENILSLVDNACYVAKDKGRNRIYTCHINDQQLLLQRQDTEWTIRINQALEENRFCLHRQAIVEIKPSFGTQSKHYEILLRMKDRNGQEIAPMAFLPAAERYGLMPKIDRWVIQSFFAYFAQENNSHPCCYCLNLSGASINDDQFLDFLEEQLALYQLPTHNLCFEITETVAIANLSKASKLIAHLKELGCYIALDDFGSGMSSFGYLKSIPCDYLKIDGHFVKDIMDDPIDEAMVDCINRMGQLIGVKTIAEFVENEMILQKLANLGVNYAQGYGISRPEILNIPDHN